MTIKYLNVHIHCKCLGICYSHDWTYVNVNWMQWLGPKNDLSDEGLPYTFEPLDALTARYTKSLPLRKGVKNV